MPPVRLATVRTTPALLMYVLFVTNPAKRASVPGAGSPLRATSREVAARRADVQRLVVDTVDDVAALQLDRHHVLAAVVERVGRKGRLPSFGKSWRTSRRPCPVPTAPPGREGCCPSPGCTARARHRSTPRHPSPRGSGCRGPARCCSSRAGLGRLKAVTGPGRTVAPFRTTMESAPAVPVKRPRLLVDPDDVAARQGALEQDGPVVGSCVVNCAEVILVAEEDGAGRAGAASPSRTIGTRLPGSPPKNGRVVVRRHAWAAEVARPERPAVRAQPGSRLDPVVPGAVDERETRESRGRIGRTDHHRQVGGRRAAEEGPGCSRARHVAADTCSRGTGRSHRRR